MKKIFLVTTLLLLCGCSIVSQCPEGTRIILRGEFPVISTPDSLQWSIVPYGELDNYCWKYHLGYVGSYTDYHLFYWWSKILPVKGAEFQFAIHKSEWTPDKPFNYKLKIRQQFSPQSEIDTNK
jgi:hypothetical protein